MRFRFLSLLALTVIALLLEVSPLYAFVEFSTPVHQLLVFLHIFGAIIFTGNIIVTAMWMAQAKRTGDAVVVYFAARTVDRADRLFTLPGVLLVLVPGLLVVEPWGGFPGASWAELALALFVLSGVVWGAVLLRLQKRMIRLSRAAAEQKLALDDQFYQAFGRWTMWGGVATLLPLVSLYLMVYKPTLWG